MKKRTSPVSSRPNEIEDGTPSSASTSWFMAGLFIVLAAGAYAYFQPPLNFDVNSRDFNPFLFVPLIFLAIGARSLVPAIRGTLMGRKFGKTVFVMEGDDVELGGTLKGAIRCSVELVPTSDYVVTVQCIEAITSTSGSDMKQHTRDRLHWEATRRTDAKSVSAKQGIPVDFRIPESALAIGDPRAKGAVRWVLDVSAEMPGTDYAAIFPFVVTSRKS